VFLCVRACVHVRRCSALLCSALCFTVHHCAAHCCAAQVEFGLPELEGRTHIFKIHTKTMSVDKDIRYELIARLCPSSTGAEIRCVAFVL
jgi:hypothetical protein